MDSAERDALLALSLTPGLGPTLMRRLVEAFGNAQAAFAQPASNLKTIRGISPDRAEIIRRELDAIAEGEACEKELERMERYGVRLLFDGDPSYPRLLKHIPDPPLQLYVRGEIREDDAVALAMVGARRCSLYGREQAGRIAGVCAQAGLTIISGGAYGIDVEAHRAAVHSGGRTIVVLGSGLAKPYPGEHVELFDQIIQERRGAIISELPMDTPPKAQNFPRRNRIISGLALGVLVVEAANRSGALITARLAAEEHGREVMALPGPVTSDTSAGCHRAIREGWAALVTNAADVLDALGETGSLLKAGMTVEASASDEGQLKKLSLQNLTPTQQKIIDAMDGQVLAMDELAARTGLAVSTIQADLTMLEIRGAVTRHAGRFSRR